MRPIPQRLALVATWILLAVVVDWAPAEAAQANHPPPSTSTSPPVDMTVRGDSLMVAGDITCSPAGGLAEGRRITAQQAAACNLDARAVHDMPLPCARRPSCWLGI